ncbi:MAG: response regulator transcription factor [Bacteroidetes bacterium]|nr:response regulator transcription factor [Bacteroidota bacterium]
MHNIKIPTVVIEKNDKELKKINSCLKNIDELLIVGSATTGNKGISLISNFAPNLVFVNVDLQDINGLEFVRVLQNRNIFPEIVFLADDGQFAYESLVLKPVNFLIKPINKEKINQMLLRLTQKLKKKELIRKMDTFTNSTQVVNKRTFKQKGGIVVLPLKEIVFCKAELTRTIIFLINGEKMQLKSGINETLETINSEDFIRIGRSYCINKKFIRKVDRRQNKCHLHHEGKTWEVPTSKNIIEQLEKLHTYSIY